MLALLCWLTAFGLNQPTGWVVFPSMMGAAVSVGLLTLYDMLKAVDPAMTIEAVQLQQKEGGRNGVWKR